MSDTYYDNINDPNYSIFSTYNFFVGGDYVRVIILLYIVLSFIFNCFIGVSIYISKKKLSFASKITLSIMSINFIHTFAYIFQWVVKIPGKTFTLEEGDEMVVGFLLVGNPNNMEACHAQAFLLISSSISQDFLINIFFYLINKSKLPNIVYIWLAVLILAFVLPLAFTLFLLLVGALGINDRFCYVNKYIFVNNKDNPYELYDYFKCFVTVVYSIRAVNLFFSLYMFIKIIRYVVKKKLKLTYIFKMAFILLVQLVTITVGIIYRISSYVSNKFSANFSGAYLILNTIDGVLFPLSFLISNGMHRILFQKITGRSWGGDEDETPYPNIDDDDEEEDEHDGERGKSIQMAEFPHKDESSLYNIDKKNIEDNDENE